MDKLYIVIPAYNESETIQTVIEEWYKIVQQLGEESKLVIIDDGSTDDTFSIINRYAINYPQLIPINKSNGGHGDSLIFGYQFAIENGADYIFQTDSDGQTVASEFQEFWLERNLYDVQIGNRISREDGLSRLFVTKVLKLVVRIIFGVWVKDANAPFRLINRITLQKILMVIPEHYNLPNIIMAVVAKKINVNVSYKNISFRKRQGGVNSINLIKIVKIGKKSIRDFYTIKMKIDDIIENGEMKSDKINNSKINS